jgi:hypothetical protein
MLGIVFVLVASLAMAGPALPGTPRTEGCLLVNTDTCSVASAGLAPPSLLGGYLRFDGAFTGSATLTFTGATTATRTCTGTFVGMVPPIAGPSLASCVTAGFPVNTAGPFTVSCSSTGTGALYCGWIFI